MTHSLPAFLGRLWILRQYVRLRPFETTTEEGRAQERYRRAALTALAAAAARGTSLLMLVVSIPLAIGYLGVEQYGVALTITALTSMLVFADFGLGNGLMNLVASAAGKPHSQELRQSVSSAFFMLGAVAALIGSALLAIHGLVPWGEFMNVPPTSDQRDVSAAVAVFMVSVVVGLPLSLVQRIQLGLQQGYANGIWNAIGSVIALAALIVGVQLELGLPFVVAALIGGPIFGNALNSAYFFIRQRPDLVPHWSAMDLSIGRRLVQLGGLFFVLQLAVAIAYQSDVVVATRVLGPAAASEYGVTLRLFMVAPMLVNMLLLPLWPAYGDALARGDLGWVRRTLRRSLVAASILTAAPSIALVVFGAAIVQLWTGDRVHPPFALVLGCAAWAVLSTAANSVAMLLNGASVMRFQIATALSMTVVSLGASIALANAYGVAGVIWGTVLAFAACTGIPMVLFLPRIIRSLSVRSATAGAEG